MSTTRALIRKDAHPDPEHPWYYTVEHDPPREDALDYGSTATWAEALANVRAALLRPAKGATAWIVDEEGGTFAFPTEAEADAFERHEYLGGQTIEARWTVTVPADDMTWGDVADYAASQP